MPVNSEGKEIEYTMNEDIDYMLEATEKDHCVEFVGYISEILGRSKVGKNQEYELYKAVITNGSKRLMLLIWDTTVMDKLKDDLVNLKIWCIDGAQGQVVTQRKHHRDLNILNYELIIQKKTIVTSEAFHVLSVPKPAATNVELINVGKITGDIVIQTYIKTVPAAAGNSSGTVSFGTGSVTDGTHKVPLQIAQFRDADSKDLKKGICILIRGSLNNKGSVSIFCPDMSYIKILPNIAPLDEDIVRKANKPVKRANPENESEQATKKDKIDEDGENDGNGVLVTAM